MKWFSFRSLHFEFLKPRPFQKSVEHDNMSVSWKVVNFDLLHCFLSQFEITILNFGQSKDSWLVKSDWNNCRRSKFQAFKICDTLLNSTDIWHDLGFNYLSKVSEIKSFRNVPDCCILVKTFYPKKSLFLSRDLVFQREFDVIYCIWLNNVRGR